MNLEAVNERLNVWVEKILPDIDECLDAAHKLRARHPDESPEALARRAIRAARQAAAAVGAATGAASTPLTMVPAALADMAAVLRIEATLAGVIAAILEPEVLTQESLQSDVVSILFPGAVSQVLRQLGIRAGERASKALIRKYLGGDAAKTAVRLATRHLGMEMTRKAIVGKTVPLVGAGIGAGWNWVEVGALGSRAIKYYGAGRRLPPPPPVGLRERSRKIASVVRRMTGRGEDGDGEADARGANG